MRCACDPSPDGTGGDTVVDHIRLFPLREGIRWTYRVHEQILPALRRANIPVEWTDLTVRHTGYVDQALRSRKLDRDSRILLQELEARPDDPFTLFNLGSIAGERKDWNNALRYLERSLKLSASSDSIVRKLYALIARRARCWANRRPRLTPVWKGSSSTRPMRNYGSARPWCTGIGANRARPSNAGGGSYNANGQISFAASIKEFTGI